MKAPMLAAAVDADEGDLAKLRYPLLASAKLDGLRCIIENGVALSRTAKPFPNQFVQKFFQEHPEYEGIDCELIVGPPNERTTYLMSQSGIMKRSGEPDFMMYIFDHVKTPTMPYEARLSAIQRQAFTERAVVLDQRLIHNEEELLEYEDLVLNLGYEGLILRAPHAPYKHGRSTFNEHYLLKFKRFKDSEAEIIGFEEEMENQNDAEKDAFGRTKRSSHQENLVGKGTLGCFNCRDIHGTFSVDFSIGTGYDAHQRKVFWRARNKLIGKIVKYSYFPKGSKERPRFPTFLCFRDKIDI